MKPSAIKYDLFAADKRCVKLDRLGDPLTALDTHIDFAALAAEVDRVAPRPVSPQGGRPPFPTETMMRILVVKRLHNLSNEQVEFPLLDRLSFQRFCGLCGSANIPDRTTVRTFENRIGAVAARALFEGMLTQLTRARYIARCGQIIDATIVPTPKPHADREEKELLDQNAMPSDWTPAQRRQKDTDATWTKTHDKSDYGYQLSINADKQSKVIRNLETGTASEHDSQHVEAVLDPGNTSRDVCADRGCPSKQYEVDLATQGYRNRIQRKGYCNLPLSGCQQRRNRRIAKTRVRVELSSRRLRRWAVS